MKIIIIGGGWYGLHIAHKYQFLHDITILEKNHDIFLGSSFNNQNRLHLGYHYPRSYLTRKLCKDGYELFMKDYFEVVENIEKNYYLISKESLIDYKTYEHIFKYEGYKFETIKNEIFNNIQHEIIKCDEKIINHEKGKFFFKKNLTNTKIVYNYEVLKIKNKENKFIINDALVCDFIINCTYGQLKVYDDENNKDNIYEKTISHVYKKIKETEFNCITIMDGNLTSLFIRNKEEKTYSLTHVEYTPLIKSKDIKDIINFIPSEETLNDNRKKMETSIKQYYPDFDKYFIYDGYYFGYKLKNNDKSDNRTCNIYQNKNYISVNGGKITGIYDFENYTSSILNNL